MFKQIFLLIAVFVVAVAVATFQVSAVSGSLLVQHSLDGGASWISRGTLDPATFEFEAAEQQPVWKAEELQQLRVLASKKGEASVAQTSVLVRVRDSADESNVHASIAVSPCALVVPRQYTTALTYIAERYGITVQKVGGAFRVNSLRLLNPFHDEVCEPTVFHKTGKQNSAPVKLKMTFVRAPHIKGMAVPFSGGAPDLANVHDGAKARARFEAGSSSSSAGGGGGAGEGDKPAEKDQSFWDKWGNYILIFFAVQALSSFFAPKPQAGGEGGGGEGGGERGKK